MKKMKTKVYSILLTAITVLFAFNVNAETHKYPDSWGKQGFNLTSSRTTSVNVIYSVNEFNLGIQEINGEAMHVLNMPGVLLQNDEGAPNLPGNGRYIALPEGATPVLNIVSMRTETFSNINMSPAPRIPFEDEDGPLEYKKNPAIYSQNAFYPQEPVKLSEVTEIRGVDVVILGVTPFQYNPVTKELKVIRDVSVEVQFEGGNGQFGEQRLRSRWWDPILEDALLNYDVLPEIDYNWIHESANRGSEECEYIIISPDGADFVQWADSIKDWRTKQGIVTNVVTLTEVGGNTTVAIEAYINNAYNNWSVPPAACLLLGDYGYSQTNNVIAPIWDNYCASDNIYADVTNNDMPDVVFARITANDATQLETMVTKFIHHERNPPTNPDFYDNPITACGWQTSRWFQICAESVGGYWRNVHNKDVQRINEIYSGSPGSQWSTATNTSTVVNYFGVNGLGYLPATPSMLGGWTGGNATMINNTIENGSFIMLHRDHGSETGWGEPSYNTSNIAQLDNEDLIFVMSINCLTGKYNWSNECFAEKFHRHTKNGHNAGALGVNAASETSYSFVNDTYVWGFIDNMWTDFMPDYGTTPDSRGMLPAFGNAAGKYFLQQSSWPYNTNNKEVTYHLFHHHGGAFLALYSEVPQTLTAIHDTIIQYGSTTFSVNATPGSMIALTHDGEILSTATGGLGTITMTIPVLPIGSEVILTITKDNYFRYESTIEVKDVLIAGFSADTTMTCEGGAIDFFDQSVGTATEWLWTFEGGDPATSTEQNPTGIAYAAPGEYDVTLEVTNAHSNNTLVKENYINVYEITEADVEIETATQDVCQGEEVMFVATCFNEGDSPFLQWYVNGTAVGDNNDTLYLSELNDQDIVSCELTSSQHCLVENPVMSNELLMNVHEYVEVSLAIETETTEVCEGHEITFTANAENPGEEPVYTWMINGEPVGDNSSTFVTTDLNDQDVVTCEVNSSEFCTTGNPATSNEVVMTVLEGVEASIAIETSSTDVCEGEEVTFTASAVNPGTDPTYKWMINGVEVGDNSATLLTTQLVDGDVVTCELYSDEFCAYPYPAVSNEMTMSVQMLPEQLETPEGPEQVDTYLSPTSEFTTSADPEATSYTWMLDPANAGTVEGNTNTCTVTWDEGYIGNVTVTVAGVNDCGEGPASAGYTVVVENTFGIEDYLNDIGIQVYPNPNTGNFIVELNSTKSATVNIRLMNSLGESVFELSNVTVNGQYREAFDLGNYAEGMYFLIIENKNNAVHKRIIYQK